MKSFNHFLREIGVSNELRSLLYHIARSIKYINFSIRAGETGICGTTNIQGEQQLKLDVITDKIVMDELEKSELASLIISEEQDEAVKFPSPRGKYTVAYDPLDGSSIVDANFAFGSDFAIWGGDEILGRTCGEMEAVCYGLYGPSVIFVIAIKDKGVHEFELNDVGEFMLTRQNITIQENSKYFAPGNLKVCAENPKYRKLVEDWFLEPKKLRYSGGMTPDLHHILAKGGGIFAYPRDQKLPNGKLRLLFECGPFSFIFKEAGGIGLDQEGQEILDAKIQKIHQRIPIFIGSKNEVQKAVDMLK